MIATILYHAYMHLLCTPGMGPELSPETLDALNILRAAQKAVR